ncbi:UNVERIFIED_CONTAM: hypothetical protein Sradi_1770100 [Sesamum radiatum]|uniref:DDE Tnp4 domain-containing protein n=1 Tax=Sesamum radiatum TaxID=300843 RepID=A0AAW2TUX4_SESRA
MQFIYVFAGWEGSAAKSRVLCDAVHIPSGLGVPAGNYYLCDNGYVNAEGFLTPYKGVRYHLQEWDSDSGGQQNHQEPFNLKHSSALFNIKAVAKLPAKMDLEPDEGSNRQCRRGGHKEMPFNWRTSKIKEEECLIARLKSLVVTS